MFNRTALLAAALLISPAAYADDHGHNGNHAAVAAVEVSEAVAFLTPTQGNEAHGVVTFTEVEGGVRVQATVHGLSPDGTHGFHIHEFGNVTSPDGSAAGGHYNPEGHDHALPDETQGADDAMRHAGDMGNLEANADGVATFDQTFDNISVAGKQNPILGRGLIVHEKQDDGGQPSGNAGPRIAQAVIGVAESN